MALAEFVDQIYSQAIDFSPRILAALLLLAVAYPLIRFGAGHLKRALIRTGRDEAVAGLAALVMKILLYYSLALAALAIIGFSELAASLGTAVGFICLGAAYAMKDVISDAVAGVYLLRDPDFVPGDSVETGDGSGEVVDVGLRKTRLRSEDGNRIVIANSSVDKKWTKKA